MVTLNDIMKHEQTIAQLKKELQQATAKVVINQQSLDKANEEIEKYTLWSTDKIRDKAKAEQAEQDREDVVADLRQAHKEQEAKKAELKAAETKLKVMNAEYHSKAIAISDETQRRLEDKYFGPMEE